MNFKSPVIITILFTLLSSCSFIDNKENITPPGIYTTNTEASKLKFIAIGDTGKGNTGQLQVAEAIKNKCIKNGCDFALMLGDNIYKTGVNSDNDIQFQTKFEIPYKDISIPFFLVLGNHDYGRSGYNVEKAFYQIQYTEKSSKWKMPKSYYQFKKKNATFFAMDTNAQIHHQEKDQQKDIGDWIAQANTEWKIAFGHHPYKSNGRHGNAGNYNGRPDTHMKSGMGVKKFAESVWCGKVDLYLSGHDHNLQWLDVNCKGTQLALSGAGASSRKLEGNNPSLFESERLGFLYISIDGKKLTAEFVGINGETEFTHIIKK